MSKIKTYDFSPINHERQKLHVISFSERIKKGKEEVLKPHRANFYILLFVAHGRSRHLIDFQVHEITAGDFLVIRPGQVHAFFQSDDSDGTIIAFTEDFLLHQSKSHYLSETSRFLSELSLGYRFPINSSQRVEIELLIGMVKRELSGIYDEIQEGILQNHLSSIILYLIRAKRGDQYLSPQKSKELLYALQFKSLVEQWCGKQATVLLYAKALGISVRRLQRISELHFGKSPKCIIQECTLLESKRMLLQLSLQVKEIAYRLGFNEPTNFTKFFKKFTNMSPEQFRKQLS